MSIDAYCFSVLLGSKIGGFQKEFTSSGLSRADFSVGVGILLRVVHMWLGLERANL